jgi:hypothetical protein
MRELVTIRFANGTQSTVDITTIPDKYKRHFHGRAPDGTVVHSITTIDLPGSLDMVITHTNPTSGTITVPKTDLAVFARDYAESISAP